MLDPQQYLQQIRTLEREYAARGNPDRPERDSPDQEESNCMEFASANLRHLLPEIPVEKHTGIINEILYNQARAALDEDSCFLSKTTEIVDPDAALPCASQQPAIFCTYHYGSYRLINQVLGAQGLHYLLPVASDIYAAQKQRYLDNFDVIKAYFHSAAQLIVINAEERTTALVMARKTRQAWSLLTYIDGNTGVQGTLRRDSKMLRISLLGQPMYARKGIAFLSHFLKLPIVPVVCEVTGPLERRMTFHQRIEPGGPGEDRDTYCRRATEMLYAVLAEYLKKTPAQWEGWMYLQRHLDTDSISENTEETDRETEESVTVNPGDRLVFNHQRFGFIVRDDERVLLDKSNYKLLSLPDPISRVLECYHWPREYPAETPPEAEQDMLEQLLELDMLTVVHS